jgi:hypothetical protein
MRIDSRSVTYPTHICTDPKIAEVHDSKLCSSNESSEVTVSDHPDAFNHLR